MENDSDGSIRARHDRYFGTYPNATNPVGEPPFLARKNTPTDINTTKNACLLTNDPKYLNPLNGAGAANPGRYRLRSHAERRVQFRRALNDRKQ
ncbi:MAG: hypothetical protein ACREHV_04575 [Rhizomicrobium sp.]